MKVLGAILKFFLTLVGIYLIAFLIGRLITFVVRLFLYPFRTQPAGFVFKSPGFMVCGDLGLSFMITFGMIGVSLTDGFEGDAVIGAWVFGILFGLLFVSNFMTAVRVPIDAEKIIYESELERLRSEFQEIDKEAANQPDYPIYKPEFKPAIPARFRHDGFGPTCLN